MHTKTHKIWDCVCSGTTCHIRSAAQRKVLYKLTWSERKPRQFGSMSLYVGWLRAAGCRAPHTHMHTCCINTVIHVSTQANTHCANVWKRCKEENSDRRRHPSVFPVTLAASRLWLAIFFKKGFQHLLTFNKYIAATNNSKTVSSLEWERWTDVILWPDNSIFYLWSRTENSKYCFRKLDQSGGGSGNLTDYNRISHLHSTLPN